MRDAVASILLVAGALLMLLASVGVVRMPDLLSRMQATTKSATLGIGLMLLAVAVHFNQTGVTTRVLLVVVFYFITLPVAAHMIGRAAYFIGDPLWSGTRRDDLRGRYDKKARNLASGMENDPPPAESRKQAD